MRKFARAVAILIHEDHVLLMHRRKQDHEYYVFIGGGVEENETVEEAVVREVMEETSMPTHVIKLLYEHHYTGDSDQYFYLCQYILGEPMLGNANEMESMNTLGDKDYYKPMWVAISELPKLLLYPLEIRDWLLTDIQNHFADTPRAATMFTSDLRRTL